MPAHRDDQEHGTEVKLRLPLRICPHCSPELNDPRILFDAVTGVREYDELLEKYPNAELGLDAEHKGVSLSASDR